MNTVLMNLFVKYMEKQEILSKLTEDEKLHGYNYSEIHTIAAIGDLEEPNVTQIANHMNVTRGAISKITKKLLEQNLIESYQLDGNKQKIFFRLTKSGQFLYDEHEKRHNLWLKRDDDFIRQQLAGILQGKGYSVVEAASVGQFNKIYEQEEAAIDVFLLDVY